MAEVVALHHHDAHAAYGLYDSPFRSALVLSLDGGGDDGYCHVYLGSRAAGVRKLLSGQGALYNLGLGYFHAGFALSPNDACGFKPECVNKFATALSSLAPVLCGAVPTVFHKAEWGTMSCARCPPSLHCNTCPLPHSTGDQVCITVPHQPRTSNIRSLPHCTGHRVCCMVTHQIVWNARPLPPAPDTRCIMLYVNQPLWNAHVPTQSTAPRYPSSTYGTLPSSQQHSTLGV